MKKFNAVHKLTGTNAVIVFKEDGIIEKIDSKGVREIKEATIKRHWQLNDEIIEKPVVEEKPKKDKRIRFSDDQVLEIRRLYGEGVRKADLVRQFGGSYNGIHCIVEGLTRKDLLQ